MGFEDDYLDVLQNIESAIVKTCRCHRELCDYDVMRTLEALINVYVSEQRGHTRREFNLSPGEQEMMSLVHRICEWRLGRRELGDDPDEGDENVPNPITLDELIQCLKRILKSVSTWSKEGGRHGYLTFVSQYVS